MRKFIVLLLVISLTGIAPADAAVVKAGAKCKKVEAIATVSGKMFTCIKPGAKLVWNKGVIIKKPVVIKAGTCTPKSVADKEPGITQARANTLVTMSEADAESCAMDLGWIYRLGQRDDELFAGTFDYRIDRITVTVMKGLVTKVAVG
jgi:hypothetical protein